MPVNTLEVWHRIVQSRDATALGTLLADDVVFESPVVHTPQRGKAITYMYLNAALHVLNNGSFVYLNAWKGDNSAVLEFESTVEGITINGVDMITWDEAGHISHFKVMVRPLKGINKVHELMGRMLEKLKSS